VALAAWWLGVLIDLSLSLFMNLIVVKGYQTKFLR